MQEAVARLRFLRPALGYAERRSQSRQVIYAFPRDSSGRVILLTSWWQERMLYAAKVMSRYHQLVSQIAWDQAIGFEGHLSQFNREVGRKKRQGVVKFGYATHEAFRAGAEITVRAVLPTGLSLAAFRELLDIVGRYKGISPYQSKTDVYGTFDVLSVQPASRPGAIAEESPCSSSFEEAER